MPELWLLCFRGRQKHSGLFVLFCRRGITVYWTGTHYVNQASLELINYIFLPPSAGCWNQRCATTHPILNVFYCNYLFCGVCVLGLCDKQLYPLSSLLNEGSDINSSSKVGSRLDSDGLNSGSEHGLFWVWAGQVDWTVCDKWQFSFKGPILCSLSTQTDFCSLSN